MFSLVPSLEELKEMMRLASSRTTWLVFAIPVVCLIGIGIVADRTTSSFAQNEHWVSHTRQVQTEIERLRADVFMAQDSRKGYLLTGDDDSLALYRTAAAAVPVQLEGLRRSTADNPEQVSRLEQLEPILQRKLALLEESVNLKKAGSTDSAKQSALTRENQGLTEQMGPVLQEMAKEESGLLAQRVVVSAETYERMRIVLGVALAAVVVFLFLSFGRLLVELRNRMRAEAAIRRLSGRILQLQDMERRKVARELHDGVGQYFASSKMTLDTVLQGGSLSEAQKEALAEASRLLELGMKEARTLSYLLHPPLLDEVGFRAAADWYISGFAERSKIKVQFTAPADLGPLTKDIELVLFRVLQESLTNIHRHAGSETAEVRLFSSSGHVFLEVADRGKGIPEELLDEFRKSTGTGVGLAGMRERVSEFQGKLDITSEKGQGTTLKVELPLPRTETAGASAAGPPDVQRSLRPNAENAGNGESRMLMAATPS